MLHNILFLVRTLCTHPIQSASWILRGGRLTDKSIVRQTYWYRGELPRIPLADLFTEAKETTAVLPRTYDRSFRTSITLDEACALATLVQCGDRERILEIGTFDGNTTLLLATNASNESSIVTVDLPPDFDPKKDQSSLGHAESKINLTPRNILASQYQNSPFAQKITQVYGDSATLDWSTLGGPFDLIFIDGCHTEVYVRSDSESAFKTLAPQGLIVWHDYGEISDVTLVVDECARIHTDFAFSVIENTRLAIAIRK